MNKVQLIGRITKDIELRYARESMAVAKFTLAVGRRKKQDGTQDADFITCVAWGKTAETMDKYLHRGDKIGVTGRIQTGSYEKDGHKVYTTDVIVEEVDFLESKKPDQSGSATQEEIPDGFSKLEDDDIPF